MATKIRVLYNKNQGLGENSPDPLAYSPLLTKVSLKLI